jgi:hypothetical protein
MNEVSVTHPETSLVSLKVQKGITVSKLARQFR